MPDLIDGLNENKLAAVFIAMMIAGFLSGVWEVLKTRRNK